MMNMLDNAKKLQCMSSIISKAKGYGANLAGICNVQDMKTAPSFTLAPKLPPADVGSRDSDLGLKPGEVFWPEDAKSAVIIAFVHPENKPELDWWFGEMDPPGNRHLIEINKKLSAWIEASYNIKAYPLPYHIEKGGIFLKDAAYYAGLGCIGKNNLLITPEYGPRVRLRAMLLSEELKSTGPLAFDPCNCCDGPCMKSCRTKAFSEIVYSTDIMQQEELPGRVGNYSRTGCNNQMVKNSESAEFKMMPGYSEEPVKVVKYCRNCEFSCPVGKI